MKSEPTTYGIDHLKKDKVTAWEGVRNYQARNFMIKEMSVGDKVLIYHSNAEPSGVVGLAEVVSKAKPDKTALDPKSQYYDAKASPEKPVWECVDIKFVKKFEKLVPISALRTNKKLSKMLMLQTGSRLSITPVTEAEYEEICQMAV